MEGYSVSNTMLPSIHADCVENGGELHNRFRQGGALI